MEKLLWLFRRKPGTSRKEYHAHYVDVHSPLGLRLVGGLVGYTVNLVQSGGDDLDAVTEIWTPEVSAFPQYATEDDHQAVSGDHFSFMGPMDGFVVEERVVLDGVLDAPPGEAPWSKAVVLLRHGEHPGEVPAGVFRAVDNHVVGVRILRDVRVEQTGAGGDPAHVAVVRTLWAHDPAALPAAGPSVLRVVERRLRVVEGVT